MIPEILNNCFLLLSFVCLVIVLSMVRPASIKRTYKVLKRSLSGEMGCSGQVIGYGLLLVLIALISLMVYYYAGMIINLFK